MKTELTQSSFGSVDDALTWINWYNSLQKPSWTPEPSTIGFIWQCLYPVILLTFGFVFVQATRKKLQWKVAVPFAINLVANLIFTPIQFGLRNLPLAAAARMAAFDLATQLIPKWSTNARKRGDFCSSRGK